MTTTEELSKRWNICVSISSTETPSQRVGRLLNMLTQSWMDANGNIQNMRQYLMKYDRKEYKSILEAIRYNKKFSKVSFYTQTVNGLNIAIEQKDLQYRPEVTFDGRKPVRKEN